MFGGAPQCPRCKKSVYMAEQTVGPGGAWHRNCLTCKECNKRLDSTTLTERDREAYCKVCYNRQWGPKGYGFASGAAFLSTESKLPKEILEEKKLSDLEQDRGGPSSNSSPRLPPRPSPAPATPATDSTPQPVTATASAVPMTSFWSSGKPASSPKPDTPPRPTAPKPPTATKPSYLQTSYTPRKVNLHIQNDTCTKCGKAVYAAELALGAGNKYHKFCLKCSDCGKLLNSTNMVDKDFDLYCRGCYAKSFGPKGYGYGNLLTPEGSTR